MISYDKDGVSVFYIDANGVKITVNPMSGDKYSDLLTIMDAQVSAENENKHAVDLYNTSLKNAQASIDAGRPADPPAKPLKKLVSDTGEVTFAPFTPTLPDLVLPVTTPSGSIAVPTVDKNAQMFAMIQAIYRKLVIGG